MSDGWIGVDLDGTLARYDGWQGPGRIGEPLLPMVERVRRWLAEGRTVKLFTARANDGEEERAAIVEWLAACGLPRDMEVTATKDYAMIELWDDRCVRVIRNVGEPVPLALELPE